MKRVTTFILPFLLVFIFAGVTHAENNQNNQQGTQSASQENQTGNNEDQVARKYSLVFPIADLGNCASLKECKSYCQDSSHNEVCIAFAKKKGFYKQFGPTQDIMTAARSELGCDSQSSCKEFCGNQENWINCGEFAKRHNLSGTTAKPAEDSKKQALLEKAKQFLGCSSYDSCRAFCSQEANRIKCMELSKMISSVVGSTPRQPLPSGNREKCQNLTQKMGSASAEEIKAYYLKNCAPPNYRPATPTAVPTNKEEYCRMYPGRCNFSTSGNTGTYSSVKGISTVRNFFQTLLDWFR